MQASFGPWSTAMSSHSGVQLSSFWKRRLTMLAVLRSSNSGVGRRNLIGLAMAGIALWILPTLRPVQALPRRTWQNTQLQRDSEAPPKYTLAEGNETGVVEGRIVDGQGNPVARAAVHLCWSNGLSVVGRTHADAQGRYRLEDIPRMLPQHFYRFYAWADELGVQVQEYQMRDWAEQRTFNFRLSPAAAVVGQLLGPEGEPVPDATVRFWERFTMVRGLAHAQPWVATTDKNGRFRVDSLNRSAHAYVDVEHPRYYDPEFRHELLRPDARLHEVTIKLRLGHRLTGSVTDQAGRPVQDAVLGFGPESASFMYTEAKTDAQGRYDCPKVIPFKEGFFDFPVNSVLLCLRARGYATRFTLLDPATLAKGRLDLKLTSPEGSISGTVFGPDGKPLKEAYVYAAVLLDLPPVKNYLYFNGIPGTETDANGRFTVGQLPRSAKAVHLRVSHPLGWRKRYQGLAVGDSALRLQLDDE